MFPWSSVFLLVPCFFYLMKRWETVCFSSFPLTVLFAESFVLVLGVINMIILVEGTRRSRAKASSSSVEQPTPNPEYPSVLIIVPTCGEGTTVLQRTMDAITGINYPKEKLSVVISDDAKDVDLQSLVLEYPNIYYKTRFFIKGHAKAGNVNDTLFAMEGAEYKYKGDLVLILDCDMAPYPQILQILVPYLYKEQNLHYGFVQSPQHFENIKGFDFLGQHYYFFYQVVLRAWNEFYLGVPCCGTNCLFQRSVLTKIGGFQTGSLTEDFKTSLLMHSMKIETKYCPEILACGYSPFTLVDFFNQRSRWAMGGLQIIFSKSFYRIWKLPFIHQWIYLFSGLSPFISVFFVVLMLCPLLSFYIDSTFMCELTNKMYALYFTPYCVAYGAMLVYLHRMIPTLTIITSIQETLFMIPMLQRVLFVFLVKSMGISSFSWKTTPKDNAQSFQLATFSWLVPYLLYIGWSLFCAIYYRKTDFWLVNTIWALIMSFQMTPVLIYQIQQLILY